MNAPDDRPDTDVCARSMAKMDGDVGADDDGGAPLDVAPPPLLVAGDAGSPLDDDGEEAGGSSSPVLTVALQLAVKRSAAWTKPERRGALIMLGSPSNEART